MALQVQHSIIKGYRETQDDCYEMKAEKSTKALQVQNIIIDGIRKILDDWEGMRAEKVRCHANFEQWRICRRQTLSALQKFQDEFDKIHQYSNAGRAFGNGTVILGLLANVLGFGMTLSKNWRPIGKELMEYGSTAAKIGGATTLTATLAECGFNHEVLNNVKAALAEDQRQTEKLVHWFERTDQLNAHLKEVFGCGVLQINDVFMAFQELWAIRSEGGRKLKKVVSYLTALIADEFSLKRLPHLDDPVLDRILREASSKVKKLFLEFCINPKVRGAIRQIYDSFKINPILLNMSKISTNVISKVMVQNIALLSYVSSIDGQSFLQSVNLTTQGIFRTVNVALSVFALFAAIDNWKNGKSKYSELVNETRIHLLKELETVESDPKLRG